MNIYKGMYCFYRRIQFTIKYIFIEEIVETILSLNICYRISKIKNIRNAMIITVPIKYLITHKLFIQLHRYVYLILCNFSFLLIEEIYIFQKYAWYLKPSLHNKFYYTCHCFVLKSNLI